MAKKTQKPEIIWNIVNSLLAGGLVFLGACVNGDLNVRAITAAVAAALIVAFTKFRDYWAKEESEYTKLFSFVK